VRLDHEFARWISQPLFAERRQRYRIEAVGRANLVERIELVVERVDRDAGLRARVPAAKIGEHAPGRRFDHVDERKASASSSTNFAVRTNAF
jgi:hypothetical protein